MNIQSINEKYISSARIELTFLQQKSEYIHLLLLLTTESRFTPTAL